MSASTKLLQGIAFLLLSFAAASQTFDDDLTAIVQRVGSAEQYTIATTIKVYDKKGGTLRQQLKASVTANASSALTIMGEIEMLQTGTQVIVVDRDEQLIEVETLPAPQRGKTKQRHKEALRLDDLQQLGKSALTFTLSGTSGDVRTYTASDTKAGIRSLVIKLNATDKKLISYALEQTDADGAVLQYVVVDYTTFAYTVAHPELLKASHFVTAQGNGYRAAAAFKGYTVFKK